MAFKITTSVLALAATVGLAAADKSSSLPVLYRVDQDHSNVVVFRGADVAKAAAAGLIKGYKGPVSPPRPAAPPAPAPYVPAPAPTTTYAPPTTTTTTPAPTTTAYVPPPTTTAYTTTPKPVVYKPAPVAYKPAPVVYRPRPVVYKPVYKPAPVAYKPAPVVYKPAPPVYKQAASYVEPQYAPVDPNYTWEYAVKEDYKHNDFGHKETRDHYLATGKYYVALPDGRFQTVTYTADETGYHPVVEYTGQASYPEEPKPTAYHQA